MKQFIKKADIILFAVLVVTGLAASVALSASHTAADENAKVIIESGGDLYAKYPLHEDRVIAVPASGQYDYYNVVKISGGTVSVTEASCKNQVCVKHGAVSRSGESIVCLPNRLVVRIDAGKEGYDYDSVTS